MVCIFPSFLASDLLNIEKTLQELKNGGVEKLHFDVMDGHFVPNLTFGPMFLKLIKEKSSLFLDVHLMVNNVDRFVDWYCDSGADSIAIHIENTPHVLRTIDMIKKRKIKAGIVLNPGTPITHLNAVLPFVDYVLVMSVNPGFGGQTFIPEMLEKVKLLKKRIHDLNLPITVMIDGGINRTTAIDAVQAGCDALVVGNAFFSNDFKTEYDYYMGLKKR